MSVSRTVQICNVRGLHARASAKFVTMASGLAAQVHVEKDGSSVVGTSIMGLMMLGAAIGTSIIIQICTNCQVINTITIQVTNLCNSISKYVSIC